MVSFSRILLAAYLAFGITGCSMFAELRTPYPPDAEMEQRFRDRKEAFEKLVTMFKEDRQLWEVKQDGRPC